MREGERASAAGPVESRLRPPSPQALFNLAYVSLVAFRDAGAAAAHFSRSLAIREAALGPDHPFTAATRAELHACHRALAAAAARPPDG